MAFTHLFWTYKRVPHACELRGIESVKKTYRLHQGVRLLSDFPGDAKYSMEPDLPDHTLIPDHVTNLTAQVLVSPRVEAFLRAKNLPDVEYLPATIFDHRGRATSPRYAIVNPTQTLAILDLDACKVTRDYSNAISRFEEFAVRPEACADLPPLFRIAELSRYLVIHRELGRELAAEGFTGNAFLEPRTLVGIDLPPNLRLLALD